MLSLVSEQASFFAALAIYKLMDVRIVKLVAYIAVEVWLSTLLPQRITASKRMRETLDCTL